MKEKAWYLRDGCPSGLGLECMWAVNISAPEGGALGRRTVVLYSQLCAQLYSQLCTEAADGNSHSAGAVTV